MRNETLWGKIEEIEFDDPAANFSFSRRLARDNDWPHDFALLVIEEYRKFAFLAATVDHEVTPSDEVDQAWHLHLTYTRHYWGPFTGALGRPLHHGPTQGGSSENARYDDNYEKTLRSYEAAFGRAPPTKIWPPAEIRFGDAPFMRRINTRRHFVLAKMQSLKAALIFSIVGVSAVSAGAIGADIGATSLDSAMRVKVLGALIILLAVGAIVIAVRSKRGGKKRGKAGAEAGAVGDASGGGKGKNGDQSPDGGDGGSGCGGGGCGGGCGS